MFVDAGRIGDGLPGPLLAAADLILVVTRTSLRALAGVRLSLPLLGERLTTLSAGAHLGLLIVGEGQPYGAAEITRQFGLPVLGSIPDQPREAGVWSDGMPEPPRFDRSALVRSVRATAAGLQSRLEPGRKLPH